MLAWSRKVKNTQSPIVYTLQLPKAIKGEGIWTLGVLKTLKSDNQLSYKTLDLVVAIDS